MRIGLVIYGSLDTVTGGFLYDRMLVNHLRSRGDEVVVLALPWRHYAAHLADNASGVWFERLVNAKVDLLLQDELNHPSLVMVNRKLPRKIRYPIVSIVHHLRCCELRPSWQNRLYRFVERNYLATVDGFVFNSLTTRSAVEDLIGKGRPSVVAYPAGDRACPDIGLEDIRNRSEERGPLRILFVGSLIPRKQLHTLIAALGSLPRGIAQLDVVGSLTTDAAYTSRIRNDIRKLSLEPYVSLLGTLEGADLDKRYAQSHLMAVPSSYEGFGIVYLEGMGFGLPALAGTAGAAHEIVTHGSNGFLEQPGNVEALAGHISELSKDRELLFRMGAAALERYAAHPTWTETCARIAGFLDNMVK